MKKYFNKIKNCLNNESGGPNLENIIGIGTSIAVFCALQKLGSSICSSVSSSVVSAGSLWNG